MQFTTFILSSVQDNNVTLSFSDFCIAVLRTMLTILSRKVTTEKKRKKSEKIACKIAVIPTYLIHLHIRKWSTINLVNFYIMFYEYVLYESCVCEFMYLCTLFRTQLFLVDFKASSIAGVLPFVLLVFLYLILDFYDIFIAIN